MAKKKTKQKQEHIGHLKTDVVYITVDDPMFSSDHAGAAGNTRYTKAALNMNENIAAHWRAKTIIGEAEYKAAGRFRGLYERIGGRGACSIDLSIDRVDGGVMADPMSLTQMEAAQELKIIYDLLGPQGYSCVEKLCGQCVRLNNLAKERRIRDAIAIRCQSMLKHMAVHWGYRTKIYTSYRNAS
jgi:hypothetical protein